jgi:DNA-binding MarR family transcriptional regulator
MKKSMKWLSTFIAANTIITVVYVFIIFLTPPPLNLWTNFNITYEDPNGDVEADFEDISKYDHIDIIELKSYKSDDGKDLVIELKVAGEIKNSDSVEYEINLYDNDDEYYTIHYQNGFCYGIKWDSIGRDYFINANIRNSNTLVVKIPLDKSRDVTEFNVEASTYDAKGSSVSDYCYFGGNWDTPYSIYIPKNGLMINGTCIIHGRLNDPFDVSPIKKVEMQIDSQSPSGWELAFSSDNWWNWSYELDTNPLSDGKHVLYLRISYDRRFDFDKFTIIVNNQVDSNLKKAEVPVHQVGDFYLMLGYFPMFHSVQFNNKTFGPYFGPFREGSGEITGLDKISINGIEYETYIQELYYPDEIYFWFLGFSDWESLDLVSDSYYYSETSWIRKSDMAYLKTEIEYYEKDDKGGYHCYNLTEITYEYPNGYSYFPLIVGNKWVNEIIEKIIVFDLRNGSKKEIANSTHEYSIEYQCLGTDEISLISGTFEVFVILNHLNESFESMNNTNVINFTDYYDFLYDYNYIVDYYAPEIGYVVKSNDIIWDSDSPSYALELVEYKSGDKSFRITPEDYYSSKILQDLPILMIFYLIPANILLSTTMYITTTEVGKYGFFKALLPFLARRKKKRNYELGFIKGSVKGVIYGNPGENYSSIKKKLNLPNGTLTYYLRTLEKEGIIRSERDGFLKRFYPRKGVITSETLELTEIEKDIYTKIQNTPGIYQKEICKQLDISQQNLNYHIQKMVKARIIRIEREGNDSKCFVIRDETED